MLIPTRSDPLGRPSRAGAGSGRAAHQGGGGSAHLLGADRVACWALAEELWKALKSQSMLPGQRPGGSPRPRSRAGAHGLGGAVLAALLGAGVWGPQGCGVPTGAGRAGSGAGGVTGSPLGWGAPCVGAQGRLSYPFGRACAWRLPLAGFPLRVLSSLWSPQACFSKTPPNFLLRLVSPAQQGGALQGCRRGR